MQLIGWTLIHSIWEGGVIALVLALAFSAARNSSANLRYALGMIGLALMVALPIATAARMNTLTRASIADSVEPGKTRGVTTTAAQAPAPSTSGVGTATVASPKAELAGNVVIGDTKSSAGVVSDDLAIKTASIVSTLEPSLPWLVAAWLLGLVLLSIRMIGGVTRTRRIVRQGTNTASDRVLRQVSRLSQALGVRQAVRTLEGMNIEVPVVIGWMRPVIVLPISLVTTLTPSQLDMLLTHELAHIRRYDFLANMLQTVVEILLFFHPAAWWLSDRIREERENCCDDIAVATCGGDRRAYTATLLTLEELRADGFGFAAAATGEGKRGTLLRRAMRLMTGGPAHVDLGARWIAGVITILAALFTTGPAVGKAANVPIASRLDVLGFLDAESDSVWRYGKGIPDPARAKPDTVLTYAGSGSFSDRWRWAEQRAQSLRSGRYWIGYLVAGDPTGRNMYYSDRYTPVRSGSATFMGRMRVGDTSGLIFSGAQLAPLVGSRKPTSTAIFLQFEKAGRNDRLARVHIAAFTFPVHFDRTPAIWIDSATDGESVAKLRALVASERSLEIRRDLVSAVGVHRDANVALPPLIQWLESRGEPEGIRREAAEALGDFDDIRALAALARVARNDGNSGVRKEAIEAFEHMGLAVATDTLMAFATGLGSTDLRDTAIESLGERREPRVIAFLTRIARGNDDLKLRRDAIEALGNMHEDGFAALSDLARNAPEADIRREAVEEIANSQPADRALDLLREVIRTDPERSVRLEAVETLAEVHDDRAVATLRDLVMRSSDPAIQVKATEALGEPHSTAAFEALRSIALGNSPDHVRRSAMETYADNTDSKAAVAFLKSIIANDPSESIRLNALEILSELNHSAGIEAVRELAVTSTDRRVRSRALEILSER